MGCGTESAPDPVALKTFRNPPPGDGPSDKVRHIDFELQHPATWESDPGFRAKDERGFARLFRLDDRVLMWLNVRNFRRAEPQRAVGEFIEEFDASDAARVAPPATRQVLRKGPTTVNGHAGAELVSLVSETSENDGRMLRKWTRVVLLPQSESEWGCLMLLALIEGVTPDVDPMDPAFQREMQVLFDTITVAK
jgi:hypothetical protein